MCEIFESLIPEVTDEDIRWAANLMDLPDNAFHGKDGNDERHKIMKDNSTIDVCACLGSGKTTLLVAKLAILARKWPHRTRGICVLSHTNTARGEIESILGNTDEGRALLSYPHFIGTIHKFINTFIALPYLRSSGQKVKTIDTEFALDYRWKKISRRYRAGLEKIFASKYCTQKDNVIPLLEKSNITNTDNQIITAYKDSIQAGIYTYEELLSSGDEALAKIPKIYHSIHDRFPILIIDEAQDNDDIQTSLLTKIFIDSTHEVIIQRFGDDNQAIYNYMDEEVKANTFPNNSKKEINNSHRFNQSTADVSHPLAINPHADGIIGVNNNRDVYDHDSIVTNDLENKPINAILLFDKDDVEQVLPAYGKYLSQIFTASAIANGQFHAVGAIHKEPDNDKNKPHSLVHYWKNYKRNLTGKFTRPDSFLAYCQKGLNEKINTLHNGCYVDRVAEGLLDAANYRTGSFFSSNSCWHHNKVKELLSCKPDMLNDYLQFSLLDRLPTQDDWNNIWKSKIQNICNEIAEESIRENNSNFFDYITAVNDSDTKKTNTYIYFGEDKPPVKINLGSIHSVKGQTHTATLVLDTYKDSHNWKMLREFILRPSVKITSGSRKETNFSRRRVHYVAMTRPKYLVCIAMQKEHFDLEVKDTPAGRKYKSFVESRWNIIQV